MLEFLRLNYKKYIFYIVFLIFSVVISAHFTNIDNDFWARLIQGKAFWQTGSILKYDFLSYTPTHIWYDHEWGSSAIFYFVLNTFGDVGLMIFKGVLIFLIFYFVTQIVDLRGVKTTTAYNFLFYFFAFHALADITTSTIRCQLLTFVFFVIWVYLLEKIRKDNNNRLLIYLPIMMVVWSNFHGGCVSGLGVLGIYAVGEFLNKKPFRKYLVMLITCMFSMLINPYGFGYVKFLAMATTMKRPLITEWRATFSMKDIMESLHFKGFMIVIILTGIINWFKEKIGWEKLDKTKCLMVLVTLVLAIKHIKHQPFFVITAAAFLYDDFYNIFNSIIRWFNKLLRIESPAFIKTFVALKEGIIYFCIVFYCFMAAMNIPFKPTVTDEKYPLYAVEFIRLNNIKGNLFASFNYGSYISYKLYPNNLIFMDGRYEEVYFEDMLPMVYKFHVVKFDTWDEAITKFKTDVIIMGKEYDVYKKLLQDKRWKRVFEDNKYAVFVPRNKAKKEYFLPSMNIDYYNKTKWNTNISWVSKLASGTSGL